MYIVYFNGNPGFPENEIARFSTLKDAEVFVFATIHEKHDPTFYIRVNRMNEEERWYDYGSWSKFYTILRGTDEIDSR